MDIVADFKAHNSSRPSSSSMQISIKPKTINFPQTSTGRIGSASSNRRVVNQSSQQYPQSLPSPTSLSSPAGNNTQNLFGGTWQEFQFQQQQQQQQQRPRSSSVSSSNVSSTSSSLYYGKDRSASEDATDYRRDMYQISIRNTNKSSPNINTTSSNSNNNAQLPTLRSALDQALGNNPTRPSSGSVSQQQYQNQIQAATTGNVTSSYGAGNGSLPNTGSSLTSYATSPSDPASLFTQQPPSSSSGSNSFRKEATNNMFIPVDDVAVNTKNGKYSGRSSRTPSPHTVAADNSALSHQHHHHTTHNPVEKKKVRFTDPIAQPEPRVKVSTEMPVNVPGKVAVMTATGAVREIRPILKSTMPPFANHLQVSQHGHLASGGIAAGSLADPHSFASARRAQIAAATQQYHVNNVNGQNSNLINATQASPITTTINAINTMNNTLSNKNISSVTVQNNNQASTGLTRMPGSGQLPRPSTANLAVHSTTASASANISAGASHHSFATLAAGYSTSSRDAAIREMMLADSPSNPSTLAFNARDSLTAQSAHLLRKTMEKVNMQLASTSEVDPDDDKIADSVANSVLSTARSGYDDIDPSATRIAGAATNNNNTVSTTASALEELRMQKTSNGNNSSTSNNSNNSNIQQSNGDALFHDRRRPRTAGPGIVPSTTTTNNSDLNAGLLFGSSSKSKSTQPQNNNNNNSVTGNNTNDLQQPLLGTVGLLSASLAAHSAGNTTTSGGSTPGVAPPPSSSPSSSNTIMANSAAALFSLPAKAITLGNFSCSAVAPCQFFSQYMVLYLQPAFEAARSLIVPYQDMSALTLIGLRFRFKIPSKLLPESLPNQSPASLNQGNIHTIFVLVEFAPSARVQLVKERVVPLIAEAQANHAHPSPQNLQLMMSTSPSTNSNVPGFGGGPNISSNGNSNSSNSSSGGQMASSPASLGITRLSIH